MKDNWSAFETACQCGPVLDIGCGDGDLSYLLASLGCDVTAIDLPASNFNWMTGVQASFTCRWPSVTLRSVFALAMRCTGPRNQSQSNTVMNTASAMTMTPSEVSQGCLDEWPGE